LIALVVGYTGKLEFDSTKPDGTMRKLMDIGYIRSLGWHEKMEFLDGLGLAYQNYIQITSQHTIFNE